jgi:hypothetical protein
MTPTNGKHFTKTEVIDTPLLKVPPLREGKGGRFPPLREGNRAGGRFPLRAGGTLRRGSQKQSTCA